MGLANAEFVNGNYAEATAILHDLIQIHPDAAEPYQTLAMLHEDQGDAEKSLLFLMVTAHLKPRDPDLWSRAASLSQYVLCV